MAVKKPSEQPVKKAPAPAPTQAERSKKDAFTIFDGRVKIFRTNSKVWQFQFWVNSEGKYARESLRTEDQATAARLAEERYISIKAKIQMGERVFSLKAFEIRDKFMAHIDDQVTARQLSAGRARNVATYTKHYLDFVGKNTMVQNIEEKMFRTYLAFRRSKKTDILATVIINESITIKQMYRWAQSEGLMRQSYKPDFGVIKKPKDEGVRDSFTTIEYLQLINYSKNWHNKTKNAEEIYYRKMTNDFLVLMANGGFRTGELRLMKWRDVIRVTKREKNTYAEVTVRAENSKVRKNRTFEMRRGDVFERIRRYSRFTGKDDFVFSRYISDDRFVEGESRSDVLAPNRLYQYFRILTEEVSKKYPDFDATKDIYSLRHLWITIRIMAGQNVYDIAKVAGTSLLQIQKHYDAASTLYTSQKMNKNNIIFDKSGQVILEQDLE